jgi:hypothetical protein
MCVTRKRELPAGVRKTDHSWTFDFVERQAAALASAQLRRRNSVFRASRRSGSPTQVCALSAHICRITEIFSIRPNSLRLLRRVPCRRRNLTNVAGFQRVVYLKTRGFRGNVRRIPGLKSDKNVLGRHGMGSKHCFCVVYEVGFCRSFPMDRFCNSCDITIPGTQFSVPVSP